MWEYLHVCADFGTHSSLWYHHHLLHLLHLLLLQGSNNIQKLRSSLAGFQKHNRSRAEAAFASWRVFLSGSRPLALRETRLRRCRRFKSCSSITGGKSEKIRAQNSRAADPTGRRRVPTRTVHPFHTICVSVTTKSSPLSSASQEQMRAPGGNLILRSGHELDEEAASHSLYLMEFTPQDRKQTGRYKS